jgi:hypothetical protein
MIPSVSNNEGTNMVTTWQHRADAFAQYLDKAVHKAATKLSKVTPVEDAGVFYLAFKSWRIDAWIEEGRTAYLQLGRFELSVSLKRQPLQSP